MSFIYSFVKKWSYSLCIPISAFATLFLINPFSQALTFTAHAASGVAAADVGTSFRYTFKSDGTLAQSTTMDESRSQYWWLSSGGSLILQNGQGMTLHGEQEEGSALQEHYATYNNEHSDGGLHPQNIFRLVTRSMWKNFSQEIYVKMDEINMSDSSDRDGSDGVLLFNRYQDQDTLYYTGIRVDGSAVIKKKYEGTYTTLAIESLFQTGSSSYDRDTNPNFIPGKTWMGIRSVVTSLENGNVQIQLYVDQNASGNWQLIAQAIDDGTKGGPVISSAGYGGVRMDYMDATMDNYYIYER